MLFQAIYNKKLITPSMASKRAQNMIKKLKRKAKNPLGSVKKNAAKMSTKMTWPEKEFKKLLKELGVKFEVQKVVGNKIFDFYIPEKNMLIEVDGDYWHANPETVVTLNKIQERNLRNDKYKEGLALGLGYKLERVWESDLKLNYKTVKSNFKKLLK